LEEINATLEYECPCCGAALVFGSEPQKMVCPYCDNSFDMEAVLAHQESKDTPQDDVHWDNVSSHDWSADEEGAVRTFVCEACGGELLTDDHTAATFCPYCENPTILPGRLSGAIRPDAVLPFQKTKQDAQAAFLALCKKKPLLPKFFTEQHRIEKITGIYVPFWLYECGSELNGRYKATRIHHWSDAHFNYTRTSHFILIRSADAVFSGIPMDASSKMDNAIMESIEPFDYSQMVDFDTAYLSGFFADKYDVASEEGHERIRQRIVHTMEQQLQSSLIGYHTAIPTAQSLNVAHGKVRYVLLPVWMLHTKYQDKTYVFAMNGQTGKMTGSFPICPKRSAAWFSGICAAVTAIAMAVQLLMG
jgi:DNA-directed RNA polymerase subunit RPC12/RpoP